MRPVCEQIIALDVDGRSFRMLGKVCQCEEDGGGCKFPVLYHTMTVRDSKN
jgi:hypothetical protein